MVDEPEMKTKEQYDQCTESICRYLQESAFDGTDQQGRRKFNPQFTTNTAGSEDGNRISLIF
jgi:hypothetical protein